MFPGEGEHRAGPRLGTWAPRGSLRWLARAAAGRSPPSAASGPSVCAGFPVPPARSPSSCNGFGFGACLFLDTTCPLGACVPGAAPRGPRGRGGNGAMVPSGSRMEPGASAPNLHPELSPAARKRLAGTRASQGAPAPTGALASHVPHMLPACRCVLPPPSSPAREPLLGSPAGTAAPDRASLTPHVCVCQGAMWAPAASSYWGLWVPAVVGWLSHPGNLWGAA